jgi:hypothetical protein
MAEIKLVEDYAITSLRNDVRDSLSMAGEQCVVLQLFHAGDSDAVPCVYCGDDTYKSPEGDCPSCYGTTFQGGVRVAMKAWALFTDHDVSEQVGNRGVYRPDKREIQFEAFPLTVEHDVVVRVLQWNTDGSVGQIEGYYMLQTVTRRSLRTGNRFGQYRWDVVAQKAQLSELNPNMKFITNYPIVGLTFLESLQLSPATTTLPASVIAEPDVRVIYFPFEVAPGGVEPVTTTGGDAAAFVFTQEIAQDTWIIQHNLGYEPSVSVIVEGEEVEGDVDFPTNNEVVVTFNTPLAGEARLT